MKTQATVTQIIRLDKSWGWFKDVINEIPLSRSLKNNIGKIDYHLEEIFKYNLEIVDPEYLTKISDIIEYLFSDIYELEDNNKIDSEILEASLENLREFQEWITKVQTVLRTLNEL